MAKLLEILQAKRSAVWAAPFIAAIVLAFGATLVPHYHVKSVSATQARDLIETGALVVDVRGEPAYQRGHIPGALSIPLAVLEAGIPAALVQAMAKPVVVYCGDGVSIGPQGTKILNDAGFAQAVNLERGFSAWQSAGQAVRTGSAS